MRTLKKASGCYQKRANPAREFPGHRFAGTRLSPQAFAYASPKLFALALLKTEDYVEGDSTEAFSMK